MTGSVLIPIKALVMNTLSLGAVFGALVWIFQDGHLSSLLGFHAFGAIEVWMPVIVFVFAFGLSMDYEVFLLSRIKECHDEGCDTNTRGRQRPAALRADHHLGRVPGDDRVPRLRRRAEPGHQGVRPGAWPSPSPSTPPWSAASWCRPP